MQLQLSDGEIFNFKRDLRQIGRSPVSWAWVLVILGIQVFVSLRGGHESLGGLYENLGLSRDGILAGRVWQILTYGFLHGGWWHAGFNALFFLVIGARIEFIVGGGVLSRATLVGIAAGGAVHVLLGSGLLVGISGACMSMLLMMTTLSPESRIFPFSISAGSLGMGVLIAALIFTLIHPELGLPGAARLGGMLREQGLGGLFRMGHACHLGGGVAGWLYGRWILRPRVTLAELRRERMRREPD